MDLTDKQYAVMLNLVHTIVYAPKSDKACKKLVELGLAKWGQEQPDFWYLEITDTGRAKMEDAK